MGNNVPRAIMLAFDRFGQEIAEYLAHGAQITIAIGYSLEPLEGAPSARITIDHAALVNSSPER